MIVATTGSSSKLVFRPLLSDDPRQRQPDIRRAEAALNWRPVVTLREGLAKTINYFEDLLRQDADPDDVARGGRR